MLCSELQDIENSPAAKAYTEVADQVDDLKFAIVDNEELFKEFNITTDDAVVVFKKVPKWLLMSCA